MQHFAYDDHLNVFRLPVGWVCVFESVHPSFVHSKLLFPSLSLDTSPKPIFQLNQAILTPNLPTKQYLVNRVPGGPLDPTYFADYDGIMQACLGTGAYCIIDIHNYARWDGNVIGQGGPSNDDFASVWSQLAQAYAGQSNVIFGLMNEPHDLDINMWADTLQAAVNGIRNAGATSQLILLPGINYGAVGGFDSSSGPALSAVQDTDGSKDKLIFDMHQYLDYDTSGGNPECVTDQTANLGYQADYLRSVGRQAFLTETGGGNTDSCVQYMCSQLAYLNNNADAYLGWVVWAAGWFTFPWPWRPYSRN